jgi:hypothetical protein
MVFPAIFAPLIGLVTIREITRNIGGETYIEDSRHKIKTKALKRAKNIRKRGSKARIIKSGKMWVVMKRESGIYF